MEDRLLMIRCRHASTDAFRRIYEKYRDDLLILAIALSHDINIAEDAVHDAFVGFFESIEKIKLTGSLKAYLSACVANRVRDLMRSKNRQPVSLEQAPLPVADSSGPPKTVIYNEQLAQLTSALAQLPYEQREIIALHIHSRIRFRAIAKSLGISVNTAKSRYRYGINKLRSLLNSEVQK